MSTPKCMLSLEATNVAQMITARPIKEVSAVLQFLTLRYGDDLITDISDGLRVVENLRERA